MFVHVTMQRQCNQFYIFVLDSRGYEWFYSYSCHYYQTESYSFCSDISTELYTNFVISPTTIWWNCALKPNYSEEIRVFLSSRNENFKRIENLSNFIIKIPTRLKWKSRNNIARTFYIKSVSSIEFHLALRRGLNTNTWSFVREVEN